MFAFESLLSGEENQAENRMKVQRRERVVAVWKLTRSIPSVDPRVSRRENSVEKGEKDEKNVLQR